MKTLRLVFTIIAWALASVSVVLVCQYVHINGPEWVRIGGGNTTGNPWSIMGIVAGILLFAILFGSAVMAVSICADEKRSEP
jgi:hypothetical protein